MNRIAVLALSLLLLLAGSAAAQTTPPAPHPPAAAQPPAAQELIYSGEATSILGRQVRDPEHRVLGRIVDLLVDDAGQPRAAIIDLGGFMGVGDRHIAVAWRALHFATAAGHGTITLDMTLDQIKATPEFHRPVVPTAPPVVVAAPPHLPAPPEISAPQPPGAPQVQSPAPPRSQISAPENSSSPPQASPSEMPPPALPKQ
ncbi:MAG: PRC-barrel domain-containing protein [Rhodospirillales bacterium]|nr:PRC-barrel domain-containing protein [Rhodospirillales bacterium]